MSRVDLERDYWNEAALDPEVDTKYISDVSTEEMIEALEIDWNPGHILEIGCGVGRIVNRLAETTGCGLFGIDISEKMLEIASSRVAWKWYVDYRVCDGRTIPHDENKFGFVYSMLVFQHLKADAISNYLIEVRRVLKPKGIFRFQFIEGTEQEPFSNHYELNQMKRWVEESGLEFIKADKGLCHYQWTWITARKS